MIALLGGNCMKRDGIYQEVAQKITELRKSKGLSQDEIAKQLDMAQSTYAGYEAANRKIPMDILLKFADYFHVSTDFLFGKTTHQKILESDNVLGKRVVEAREQLGMTQKELAAKTHLSERKIHEIENGMHITTITVAILSELATALNVQRSFLLGSPQDNSIAFQSSDTLGDRLRKIRQGSNRSKQELAAALNVTVLEVDAWENNAEIIDEEMRRRFCELHGVPNEVFRSTFIPTNSQKSSYSLNEADTESLLQVEKLFLSLNKNGRSKLLDYAQDIITSPKYSAVTED